MLFRHCLEGILGSKVKIKILRTLWKYKGKEFTIRELSRFLGISHTGIRKVLDDLEQMNVITVRTVGKSYVFRLNTKSYLAGVLEEIFKSEENALSELKNILKEKLSSPEIISVALFGSIVEEKEKPRSDIDLLILTGNRERAEKLVVEAQKKITEIFGNSISAYYLTPENFEKRRESHLIKQILKNHILILGKPISEKHVD
jgi:predicted nucleotidyltransferase